METGHTHVLVPLHTWNTIKKHIAVLEQTGSEILELSQKRCDVSELSGVVKNLMESIDTDISAFCSYDSDASLFEEAIEEPNDVPQSVPKEDGVSMPEVLKISQTCVAHWLMASAYALKHVVPTRAIELQGTCLQTWPYMRFAASPISTLTDLLRMSGLDYDEL